MLLAGSNEVESFLRENAPCVFKFVILDDSVCDALICYKLIKVAFREFSFANVGAKIEYLCTQVGRNVIECSHNVKDTRSLIGVLSLCG